jgi:Pyridoxamine 5'-phosphate oxidase
MDETSAGASLPAALRAPLSRNVTLLLDSRIPARLAWVTPSGKPRVVAIWFHWTGEALTMATFAGSSKLDEISPGDVVAITIDTDTFPYRSLRMGGPVELVQVDDLAVDYRTAAVRYLGPVAGASWCRSLEGRAQVLMRLTPTWATVTDMSRSPFLAASDEPTGSVPDVDVVSVVAHREVP